MKYKLGSLTLEDIDQYVRVTVAMGNDQKDRVKVTKKACPTALNVAELVTTMRDGCWPDKAVLQACSRVAEDARNNKIELFLD
jgi:hypothetical protein